jgi:hypothetical protein
VGRTLGLIITSLLLGASAPLGAATVYVVMSCDTSIWYNTSGQHVEQIITSTPVNEMDTSVFSNPLGVYHDVFDQGFRDAHTDSQGHPFVFTWFMHGGGWFHYASNLDDVGTTTLIRHHWQSELDRWGDQISLHFHHYIWDGQYHQAPTWNEKIWEFEWVMSQMVLDHGILPVSFRSGWNYMDDPYQQTLERWIPFRMEGGSWMSQDVPYHPSFSDYRQPGTMSGWEVRHRYFKNVTLSVANQIFDWAAAGQDQVCCFWSHQNETDFIAQIADVDANLHAAAASHPGVEFVYCTASEAMRRWQGSDDTAPPSLILSLSDNGGSRTLHIGTDPDIFQAAQPYVAARLMSDEYIRLDAVPVASGLYEVANLSPDLDLVGVAVCDSMGNATIRELRDGSRRWTTQPEFVRAERQSIDPWFVEGQVALERSDLAPILEQTQSDGATPALHRSYWIGQTFVPSQPGLSRVEFGATVTGGPAEIRVELRTVGAGGFPDDSDAGLLASGSAILPASGTGSAILPFSGFVLDGRQYALVFKQISGTAKIRMHTTGSYAGGNLVRAFSLDWIHIPAFDCVFTTFDQDGNPDQSQSATDADTYVLERGLFLSQTFVIPGDRIDRVTLMATTVTTGDVVELQLRRTLPDGRPDLGAAGLIAENTQTLSGPGSFEVATDWAIPEVDQGHPLALTLVSPQSGQSSVAFASQSGDPSPGGELFESNELESTATGHDLWFRLAAATYPPQGTMRWDFDAEQLVLWTTGTWDATEAPPQTRVTARFAFAPDQAGLDAAPWSDAVKASPFAIPTRAVSRWIRIEVSLESLTGSISPTLRALEINYLPVGSTAVQSGLLYR